MKRTCLAFFSIAILVNFTAPLFSQSTRLVDSPFAESRLWNAEDIEGYYQYLLQQEVDPHPDRELSAELKEDLDALGDSLANGNVVSRSVYNWFTGLFPGEGDSDAEIMRRVAYGILKNWPASERMMRRIMHNFNPVTKQMLYGAPLLKQMWLNWDANRRRMFEFIEGLSHSGAVESHFRRWREYWGPDPDVDLPSEVPQNYLPEEFDGFWYLSLRLESETVTYYATFRKKGHIFENWTNSNTEVVSHFMNNSEEPYGPYPVEICFNIPFDGDTIYFTDDYLKIPQEFRWFEPKVWYRVEPRSYQGPDGPSPHVAFKFDYPIMVSSHLDLQYAEAVLASAPGDHFMEVFARIKDLKSKEIELGLEMRRISGPFEPAEGGKTVDP